MTCEQCWQHSARRLLFGDTARQGYFAAADQALISLINFLATVMVVRYTTPTDLGVYAVGFSALTFVRNTMEGLVIQPLNVYGAGMEEDEFAAYTSSTAVNQLALAALTALVSAMGGWLLIRGGNDVPGAALFHLWFVLSFWQLQEFVRRLFYTFARQDYQTMVLCALRTKFKEPGVNARIPQNISAFQGSVRTDLSSQQLAQLACLLPHLKRENILFASFPAELLPPGRVYHPYYKKTTFAIQADNQALRAYVEKFLDGSWPDQPEEPACP